MGSVHYLAPELAKGEPASAQSDIYALGIVFYEMLTGDVPFKADTAVQVALMQMRNEMPSVRSMNPAIPQSVENIISKATAKDPLLRYNKCYEMFNDLRTCLRADRANEEKLILSPRPDESQRGFDTQTVSGNATNGSEKRQPAVEKKRSRIHMDRILLGVLLAALLVGGSFFVLRSIDLFRPESRVAEVPDLRGRTLQEARDLCTESSLVLDTSTVQYILTDHTEKGQIISVSPEPGTEVEKGSRVNVVVSSGIGVTIRSYVGWSIADARSDLSQYSLLEIEAVHEDSEEAEAGTIIRQELLQPGDRFNIASKAKIRLVYASYPTIVIPANLIG
ncbi:MAG: PASTA domain-containing protein, partial [Solobacterium sp.]|nr:PASTA domain-containing protein [Solobacterium sp.]